MPLDKGKTSLRLFRTTSGDLARQVPGFNANSLPPFEYIKQDPVFGWTTWRHFLDRDITVDTASIDGSATCVHLVSAWRAVSPARLKAEVRAACMRRQKETGQPFLSRQEKHEVLEGVKNMLLPDAPVQLKGNMLIQAAGSQWVFTDAVAPAAADALSIQYRHAQRVNLDALTPESLAALCANAPAARVASASFSRNVDDKIVSQDLGHDFLTWLWYASEVYPELLRSPDHGAVHVGIEGPLTFVMEGSGAHKTTLSKGNPPVSSEARACLQAGKKLASCKLNMALGDKVWSGRFSGEDLVIRGMALPSSDEDLDAVSAFQERMRMMDTYVSMLCCLFSAFLASRASDPIWAATVREMRTWVQERNAVY